jgi:hypothetical protein
MRSGRRTSSLLKTRVPILRNGLIPLEARYRTRALPSINSLPSNTSSSSNIRARFQEALPDSITTVFKDRDTHKPTGSKVLRRQISTTCTMFTVPPTSPLMRPFGMSQPRSRTLVNSHIHPQTYLVSLVAAGKLLIMSVPPTASSNKHRNTMFHQAPICMEMVL